MEIAMKELDKVNDDGSVYSSKSSRSGISLGPFRGKSVPSIFPAFIKTLRHGDTTRNRTNKNQQKNNNFDDPASGGMILNAVFDAAPNLLDRRSTSDHPDESVISDNGGGRASVLRYRKKMTMEDDESEGDFRTSTADGMPSSLLATGHGVSMSALQAAMEESKSESFRARALEGVDGADDWHKLIKPFVSDLAFRSIVTRKSESAVCFDPYTCEAAVLFVDLSGYSKITAAISHKGAHAISHAVNAYLDRLLQIIDRYGGDVIKFAGDAVLVVWAGNAGDDDELEYNLLCASKCALELQRQAGKHAVKGTEYSFRIHCGLCCGMIESEIFAAASHIHMQRLFHSLSGQPLVDISELVDLAKSGEIAISEDVADYLGTRGEFETISGVIGGVLLTDLDVDDHLEEAMDQHVLDSKKEREARRISGSEEDFIHPNVLRLLRYGGLSPTQIAQMRNLCVLFIGMTSNGNSVNWLMEVQGVLDRYRCPIIQIIDDDKGTHVVAAVNLCESVPESAVLGLDACRELVSKQIGCAIGVAMGSTFCGVTGSSGIACRWDITGPHPVRAARLMQYALLNKCEVAIDGSLLEDSMAATRMTVIDPCVEIKGSPDPCVVYGLSGSKIYSVFRVLENTPGIATNKAVNQVRKCINTGRTRCAVILTGAPFAGKKTICQKAAALSDLVPFVHVCNETAGLAQLARTIATWYSYVKKKEIRKMAANVLEHLDQSRWSKAHDECVDLVTNAVDGGLRACFLVDRIQFLDSFSLSILRGCLEGKTKGEHRLTSIVRIDGSDRSLGGLSCSDSDSHIGGRKRGGIRKGKIVFLGCHLSLYNRKSAEELQEDITRSCRTFRVRVISVEESTPKELKSFARESFDLEADDRWLRCHREASGVSLAYFVARAKALRKLSRDPDRGETRARDVITSSLRLQIPSGSLQACHRVPLSQVSADLAMKTLQLFDDLPPLFQTLTKVVAIATRQAGFKIPNIVAWKVMNDLYGDLDSSRFAIVLGEMKDMHLLRTVVDRSMDKISFESPIVADVALTVCTPHQIHIISEALLYRLEAMINHDFKVPLVIAYLLHETGGRKGRMQKCWKKAYAGFLQAKQNDPTYGGETECQWWMEYFSEAITSAGFLPTDVLGEDFVVPIVSDDILPPRLLRLKSYVPPITIGPLGHTLSTIGRCLFHDYGAYVRDDYDLKQQHQIEISAASSRYFKEVTIMEAYLGESGLGATKDQLAEERILVNWLALASSSEDEVLLKSDSFQAKLVIEHVQPRLERIRDFVSCLTKVPDVVTHCNDKAIKAAYYKADVDKCWKDGFEDALMVMAVMNWKPRMVQECKSLPTFYLQTICQIRDQFFNGMASGDKVNGESKELGHRYIFADFQGFLLMTALLYNAMDTHGVDLTPHKIVRRQSDGDLEDLVEDDEDAIADDGQHHEATPAKQGTDVNVDFSSQLEYSELMSVSMSMEQSEGSMEEPILF